MKVDGDDWNIACDGFAEGLLIFGSRDALRDTELASWRPLVVGRLAASGWWNWTGALVAILGPYQS